MLITMKHKLSILPALFCAVILITGCPNGSLDNGDDENGNDENGDTVSGAEEDIETSLALDSSGNPHISYCHIGELKYAYYDGSEWHTETADYSTYVGNDSSLALDSNNYPHVVYCHYDTGTEEHYLKYAYKDAGGWHAEIGVDTGYDISYPAMDLDSNGYPHIIYRYTEDSAYASELKYAYMDGSGWHIETIDNEGGEYYMSMELDSNGYPRISYTYYDDSQLDEDLRYAWYVP